MKAATLFSVFVLLCAFFTQAQQGSTILDGKTFSIEIMKDGILDSKETLIFDKGMMDPVDCHQWGFAAASYEVKSSGDMHTFRVICTSEKEGTMSWQGKISGHEIEGSMVWTKEGQERINYTFKGKEITGKKQ